MTDREKTLMFWLYVLGAMATAIYFTNLGFGFFGSMFAGLVWPVSIALVQFSY